MPDGEFEGYTKARLKDITKRLERIETKIDHQNGRIVDNEKDIAFIRGNARFWVIGIPLVISIVGVAAKLVLW